VLAFHVWSIIGLYPFTRVSDAFTRVSLNSPIYEEASLEEVTKFIDKFITCAKETNSTADIATNS
jgi:putative alpha-1,2-mannosidase